MKETFQESNLIVSGSVTLNKYELKETTLVEMSNTSKYTLYCCLSL